MDEMPSGKRISRNRFTQTALALAAEKNIFYSECHSSALRHDKNVFWRVLKLSVAELRFETIKI